MQDPETAGSRSGNPGREHKRSRQSPAVTTVASRAKSYFYAIGTADPGTGSKDGYFFTMSELADVVRSTCMHGIQVWLEHGDASREIIGDVIYSWLDAKSGLMVVLRFDSSTLRSKVILQWIKNGLFSGISLGYNADVKYEEGLIVVHKKTIVELSIVRDPFHKSCKIGFIGNTLPLPQEPVPLPSKQLESNPWEQVFSCITPHANSCDSNTK